MKPTEKTEKRLPCDELDDFWDIAEMLPEKKKPMKKPAAVFDTQAVTVSTGEKAEADPSLRIPPRAPKPKQTDAQTEAQTMEYTPENDFMESVRLSPWPSDFGFYRKFRSDAIRYFDRAHEPCEYVHFFSYMPQYDQMTASQMAYYLYWRAECRKGNFLRTDNSYILLLAYEVINLADRMKHEEGAALLAKLWGSYREDYPYLDKYLGEWYCDYCLIHRLKPDLSLLEGFLPEAIEGLSIPEIFLEKQKLSPMLAPALCAYDYKKSKYYDTDRAAYDEHIPRAIAHVAERAILPKLELYGLHPVRLVRDSFSGAVVCKQEKYKIELCCYPIKRSYEFRQLLSRVAKLCENQLRAAFGIKSRFHITALNDDIKRAVDEYFDAHYPHRNVSFKKKQEKDEEARYMALYEPENQGPADISRALAIEEAAWETAALLETEAEEEPIASPISAEAEPIPAPMEAKADFAEEASAPLLPILEGSAEDEDEWAFLHAMAEPLRLAVIAAAKGEFTAFCRKEKRMPDQVAGEINELAMDAMGDIIIDGEHTLVSDYEDDILSALNIKED